MKALRRTERSEVSGMPESLERQLAARLALLVAVLVGGTAVAYRNVERRIEAEARVQDRLRGLERLEKLSHLSSDLEMGARGFALSGQEAALGPYEEARGQMERVLAEVGELAEAEAEQAQRLAEFRELLAGHLEERAAAIRAVRTRSTEEGRRRMAAGEAGARMERMRQILAAMREAERSGLAFEMEESKWADQTETWALSGLLGVVATLLASGAWRLRRHLRAQLLAERQVRANEEQLRVALLSIGEGVVTADEAGRVTRLNREAERLTGWSEGEAVGRPLAEVVRLRGEDDGEEIEIRVEEILGRDSTGTIPAAMVVPRGGAPAPADVRTGVVRGEDGRPLAAVLALRDVSEERTAARALAASEERYRQITEGAPYAILIQCDGQIAYANPAALTMLGAGEASEVVGRELLGFVHPSHREIAASRMKVIHANAIPLATVEQQWLRTDGSAFWVQAAAGPIQHEGRAAAVVMLWDVSRRRAAEAAAAEHELQIRTISANLPDGAVYQAVQHGGEYHFTYVGPGIEALTGLPAEQMLGRINALRALCTKEDSAGMWAAIQEAVERMRKLDHEMQIWTAMEEPRWLHFRAMPLRLPDGGIQWDGVVTDVTARKRAEEKLQRLNAELERRVSERTAAANEAELRYRTIFGAAPVGVLIIDPETLQAMDFNDAACEQLGYTRAEFGRLRINDYEAVEEEGETREKVERVLAAGGAEFETRHRTKTGELRRVQVRVKTIELSGKRVFACTFTDVTNLEEMAASLKESEDRFRLLVASIRDYAIIGLDPEGRVTAWNQGAQRIFGWRRGEVIGRPHMVFYPTEAEAGEGERLLKLAREAGSAQCEGWCVRRDGTRFWGEVVLTAQFDESGRLRGYSKVTRDRTTQRQTEEEILAQRSRLELAQQIGQLGDWDWDPATGRTTWSAQVHRMFGRDPLNYKPNYEDFLASVHAEDRPRFEETLWKVRAERRPIELDFRINDAAGQVHWLASRAYPRLDERGAVAGLYGTVQDVTERVQVQMKLAASEQTYRRIVETATEGICMIDPEQRMTFVNRQMGEMLGYGAEEMTGRSVFDFLDEQSRQEATEHSERLRKGVEDRHDFRFRRKDGKECWAIVSTAPMHDEQGRYAGALGMVTDITDRKRLEQMYLQSQKMEAVGRLAGGIAHDFNNLLSVVNGYAEMLLKEFDEHDPVHERLRAIQEAGWSATDLTRQLLTFGRKQLVDPKVLDLNQLVEEGEKVFGRVLGEDIELRLRLQAEVWPVKIDRTQFLQVLMNLVVNARDAMPEGGSLALETANVEFQDAGPEQLGDVPCGEFVQLTVSDSGAGMDEETRLNVFEPFFTTKEAGKGTGLGLATVYGIVRQAGGWIRVYSEPGQGTTFRIYLPRVREAEEAPAQEEESAAAFPLRGAETILVVEDQKTLLRLVETVLKKYGYRVLTSANAGEALLAAEQHSGPIHLLLTDVIMPGMTGRQLAERLVPLRPGLRVLYMSGHPEKVIAERGILIPGVEYIAKPFSPEALAKRVRKVLGVAKKLGTVLVADDEAGVRRLAQHALQAAGFEVLQAEDGKQAMKELESRQADVALIDLAMPEQEGLETIRAIRKRYPAMKIVAISGAFGGDFLEVARQFGADAARAKPIPADELVECVRRVLAEGRESGGREEGTA